MNQKDIIELNITRLKSQLHKLTEISRPELKEQFKHCSIYNIDDEQVKLDDIDFSKPLLFISEVDFSAIISTYGLLQVNNIPYPDINYSGNNSRIRTSYMVVNSPDIRYSKMYNDYTDVNVEDIPEMYEPINYIYKDICIWRLFKEVGQGSNENMYRLCSERIYERYLSNKNDWIFFIGSYEDYEKTYNLPIELPTYFIRYTRRQSNKLRKEVF